MLDKKAVVISAINFFEGGPLSVFKDCLHSIQNNNDLIDYEFIALVHKVDLFAINEFSNIKFIEFPKSRKSYFYRIYYEYFYFKKFAKNNNISFWLSLHDMTPNLKGVQQAVYCHNPAPFNTLNFKDIYIQPTQFFFRLFYKFLYQINIKRNKYVIVQQLWMKNKFVEMFNLEKNHVMIAPPQIPQIPVNYLNKKETNTCKTFFFPTFPRPFKNIEVICEAAQLIALQNLDFKVLITIDGSENKYAKAIFEKYNNCSNIDFIGLINREKVYEYYSIVNALIFPSKLETWGLPISEFKQFNKPMFVADLPYAKETVSKFDYVNFFEPKDAKKLAELMINFINDEIKYDQTYLVKYEEPYAESWNELFQIILKS